MINQPFEILNVKSEKPLILICDHASNYVPPEYNDLGLNKDQLNQHIGWDIGAANLTRKISKIINATAILCGTSRLIIDANRSPADKSCIPTISDNIVIPINKNISKIDRLDRIKKFFWPYHNAISTVIRNYKEQSEYPKNIPLIFSIHTFAPVISSQKENERPWHAGVLWNRDPRVSYPLIKLLKNHPEKFVIGDNEPYSGQEYYYSLDFHAGNDGLPHCAIEVRQDLVKTTIGSDCWAKIISNSLVEILHTENIHERKKY